MPLWTRLLGGADASAAVPGASPRFEWLGLPTGPMAVLAVAAAAGLMVTVVMLYRRERARGAPWKRYAACALRLLVLGAAALILLEPSVAFDVVRIRPGTLVFLVDRSASMSIADGPQGTTRHEAARASLDPSLLARCCEKNAVQVMAFAEGLQNVLELRKQEPEAPPLAQWQPTGPSTDIAGAIGSVLQQARRFPLAGIVLLSDGRHTGPGDPEDAARAALRQSVRIHTVGFGNPVEPQNVVAVQVTADDHVMLGSPLLMQVMVKSRGFEGREAEVVLTWQHLETGETQQVGRKVFELGRSGKLQQIPFSHEPERAGQARYTARITPLAGETDEADNTAHKRVSVLDEKVKVLLVAGGPSFEYRFLSALIERDPGFELNVRLQTGGPDPLLGELPSGREAIFSQDVILLLDPDPGEFTPEWLDHLAAFVSQQGGGLVWVASLVHTPQFLGRPELSRIHGLLPVATDGGRTEALIGVGATHTDSWPVELTREGAQHQLMRVREDQRESEAFWSSVPGLYWTYPVVREKPGATVLLRYRNPFFRGGMEQGTAVAAVQPYGAGRTFFLGCDETWRWRAAGLPEYRRFWIQLLRYVAHGRALGGRKRAQVVLDSSTYPLGDPVRVQARLLGEDYRPRTEPSVEMGIERDGIRVGSVTLERIDEQQGLYEGFFYPEEFGRFELYWQAPGGQAVREPFAVARPDVEFEAVSQARDGLRRLSALTGGVHLEPSQMERLPELVEDRTETSIDPGEPVPLWGSAALMALLIVLLGAEWAIRKWMGAL